MGAQSRGKLGNLGGTLAFPLSVVLGELVNPPQRLHLEKASLTQAAVSIQDINWLF